MIQRLNAAILNYVKSIKLRSAAATVLGGVAGLGVNSNIIPSALGYSGITDTFSARWDLGGYAVYSMMIWAVGGWAAQKTGSRRLGAFILGLVGLLSGLLLTGYGISTQFNALLYGGGAAMLYGAAGGLIIAEALRQPDLAPMNDQPGLKHSLAGSKKKDSSRFFRYFK